MIEEFPTTPGGAATSPDAHWPRSVVCGVDGTAAGREAARQAAELAGPGTLELITVMPGNRQPPFLPPPESAAEALAAARLIAGERGVTATARSLAAGSAAEGLIRAAAGADLLVIGCDALGRVPTAVLRRAPCSVLLARRPPDLPLCDLILVTAAGPPRLRLIAAQLANHHGSELHVTGAVGIATAAAAIGCGLIVTADDATAADVARTAPCSVLVVRDRR